MEQTGKIPTGTVVFCYNTLTGYNNFHIAKHFRRAIYRDLRKTREGDIVWVRVTDFPYSLGYKKSEVREVGEEVALFSDGSVVEHSRLFFVRNEAELAKMIENDPGLTETAPAHVAMNKQSA